MASQTQVSFLIISDTHSFVNDFTELSRKASSYPSVDVLIHCGDLTNVGTPEEYQHALHMLSTIQAELRLVIAGNHDLSLDEEFCRTPNKRNLNLEDHRKAKAFWQDYAKSQGVTYLEEGLRTFTLKSGASFKVYASPYQPQFGEWAFGYPHAIDRFNPPTAATPLLHMLKFKDALSPVPTNPIPAVIDILLTHGPPLGQLDENRIGRNCGCPHLAKAVARVKPRLHCFGHIHEGRGAVRKSWAPAWSPFDNIQPLRLEDSKTPAATIVDLTSQGGQPLRHGKETVFVNAAIRDGSYHIENNPWLVKLDLLISDER